MNIDIKIVISLLFAAVLSFAGCADNIDPFEPDKIPEGYILACDAVRKAYSDTLLIESAAETDGKYSIRFSDGSEIVFDDVYAGTADTIFINRIEIHNESVEFSLSNGGYIDIPFESCLESRLKTEREIMYMMGALFYDELWEGFREKYGLDNLPVGKWPSVCRTDRYGRVVAISFTAYSEVELPPEIGKFEYLHSLYMYDSGNGAITGALPKEIGNCRNLRLLQLSMHRITALPDELSNCKKLVWADLHGNSIRSGIPFNLGNTDLVYLNLSDNGMEGLIPRSITDNGRLWRYSWGHILKGNNFNTDFTIPGPEFKKEDINGELIDSGQEYRSNKLTVFLQCGGNKESEKEVDVLKRYYRKYSESGLEVIAISHYDNGYLKSYAEKNEIPWRIINSSWELKGDMIALPDLSHPLYIYGTKVSGYPTGTMPAVTIVDSDGNVVYESVRNRFEEYYEYLDKFFAGEPVGPVVPDYPSVPYVDVKVLQKASKGEGIDIIFMGDAYSQESIDGGGFDMVVKEAVKHFFNIEPFKTWRDCFNVHVVYTVSENEGYAIGKPVLGTWFGKDTKVGGDDEKVISYALEAVSEYRLDKSVIVVLMNKDKYAGTSYLYPPKEGDCGNGRAISYIPVLTNAEKFKGLVQHEVGGHSFAKLADEYATKEGGQIPQNVVDEAKSLAGYGWYKNIDFTSDPSAVKWSRFITDKRYVQEEIGVYQSAMTYWTGIWKPALNSMMRYNEGAFNAPSREAVYYRIHKLAYGDDWVYDYEDFVEYDAVNRAAYASGARVAKLNYVEALSEPLAPPVVVGRTWR